MNCILIEDDQIAAKALQSFIEKTGWLKLAGVYNEVGPAVYELQNNRDLQLIFLDIELPDMSGLDFLRNFPIQQQVIMVTTHKDLAADAYDYNVTDFLVKPVDYPRFLKSLARVKELAETVKLSRRHGQRSELYIKEDARLKRIDQKEIHYVEALADYVTIHMTNGNKHVILSTMKALESRLEENEFARVHRSFIIRLDKILEIEENTVVLNGKNVPVSRTYQDAFYRKLNLI